MINHVFLLMVAYSSHIYTAIEDIASLGPTTIRGDSNFCSLQYGANSDGTQNLFNLGVRKNDKIKKRVEFLSFKGAENKDLNHIYSYNLDIMQGGNIIYHYEKKGIGPNIVFYIDMQDAIGILKNGTGYQIKFDDGSVFTQNLLGGHQAAVAFPQCVARIGDPSGDRWARPLLDQLRRLGQDSQAYGMGPY